MNYQNITSTQFDVITESNIRINQVSNINTNLSTHYIVYRIDNTLNGKYYIGQHHTINPYDSYMGSGKLIIQAIKKHGVENFIKTILFDYSTFDEMNQKEKELLPLSACYPQNPMSYNLIEGGTSQVNKFAGKSDEEKQEIQQKIKNTRDSWSDEQKQQHKQLLSKISKQSNENLSSEKRMQKSLKCSIAQKQIHEKRSYTEQQIINQKISKTKCEYSDERKKEIQIKAKNTIANYSEDKKQLVHMHKSNATKQQLENETPEQYAKRIQKQKETWANKSQEEIQIGVNKWKTAMSNKTQHEKDLATQKRLATLNNRSDEEKQQSKNKRKQTIENRSEEKCNEISAKHSLKLKEFYQKHPEHAKEHSKRMSGEGNPSYGKKWMNNGKERIFVKASEIQKYIELGYVIGWIKVEK